MPVVGSRKVKQAKAPSPPPEPTKKHDEKPFERDDSLELKSASSSEPEDFDFLDEELSELRANSREEYEGLIDATKDLFLHKLVRSSLGCRVFDELCTLVDVNQEYVDILPQWKDLAHLLEVDELRTQWVQACVRPKEGLTRSMLEIYMKDGGTLGEVLAALMELNCLQILEKLKPVLNEYLNNKNSLCVVEDDDSATPHKAFFSILSTLVSVFGKEDPCINVQKFSDGLRGCGGVGGCGPAITTSLLVQSGRGEGVLCNDPNPASFQAPKYDPAKFEAKKRWEKIGVEDEGERVVRILLLFSDDGVAAAGEVCQKLQGMVHENMRAEVFRLNETSLWYEMLVNPEACCMKWANEADYIMPVLTPNFLREIHNNGRGSDDDDNASSSLVPTSPLVNRLMYNLMRARYAEAGCRNTMIRPVIPAPFLGQLSGCSAVKADPMFRLIWVPDEEGKLKGRVRGMLAQKAQEG